MKDDFDLKRLRGFFDNGVLISRSTWAALLAHAEFLAVAVEAQGALCNKYRDLAMQSDVPDGFALVPIEPTEEMKDASERDWSQYDDHGNTRDSAVAAYKAMLAAAPGAPQAVAAPDRDAVLEEAALCCEAQYTGNPNGLHLIAQRFAGIIRALKQAPQPITGPAIDASRILTHHNICVVGRTADGSDIDLPICGDGAKGGKYMVIVAMLAASQQPVPALSASIDSDMFCALLATYHDTEPGNGDLDIAFDEIVEYANSWAAQLVQQRATLSDQDIESIMESMNYALDQQEVDDMIKFARAILNATGVK